MGNLNAANASETGRMNAALNSIPGQLHAYELAVEEGEIETLDEARAALGAISNKSSFDEELGPDGPVGVDGPAGADAVDAEVVAEVNDLLDIDQFDEPAEEE